MLKYAINTRPALHKDADQIAAFSILAGAGIYEFLLQGIIPDMSVEEILTYAAQRNDTALSYQNSYVAFCDDTVIGMINACPSDRIERRDHPLVPEHRMRHVAALDTVCEPGSFYINGMAVSKLYRSRGVGAQLLEESLQAGRDQGFERVSLHVWADNNGAARFYTRHGFRIAGIAHIAHHARLPHEGGALLMSRAL